MLVLCSIPVFILVYRGRWIAKVNLYLGSLNEKQ